MRYMSVFNDLNRSSDVMYCRPVCIVGPQSDIIAENLLKQGGFPLYKNIEEVLGVCAKVYNEKIDYT